MKSVPVKDAVGLILCHDITEIVPGSRKGPAFRRGHVVKAEDIDKLLRMGKEHIYVWEDYPDMVHEDDAAFRIASAIAGPGVSFGKPKEGRINLYAEWSGLLCLNTKLLEAVNSIEHVTLATIHSGQGVAKGRTLAGTRVIPLAVPESTLAAVEACCEQTKLVEVKPYQAHKAAIVTTGSEVFHGRIKDGFGPVLRRKFQDLGVEVLSQVFVPDETAQTVAAIEKALAEKATMVVVSGGMSVDPDDKTPAAIKAVATETITYGAPVFPGAMFMLAYVGDIPVMGLPGCVMYHKASVFDVLLPRILTGTKISRPDILSLAHGGLCENCPECHYPACGFGKTGV